MEALRAKAKRLIDEMDEEDLAKLVPLIEHISGLRETLDIMSEDPDVVDALVEAERDLARRKVTAGGGR